MKRTHEAASCRSKADRVIARSSWELNPLEGVFCPDGIGVKPTCGVINPLPPAPKTKPPVRPSSELYPMDEGMSIKWWANRESGSTRYKHTIPEIAAENTVHCHSRYRILHGIRRHCRRKGGHISNRTHLSLELEFTQSMNRISVLEVHLMTSGTYIAIEHIGRARLLLGRSF